MSDSTAIPTKCKECGGDITNGICSFYEGEFYHSECEKIAWNRKEGRPYPCPACQTFGVVKKEVQVEKETHFSKDRYQEKEEFCDLCKGFGYTDKKYIPKMVQQGWEEGKLCQREGNRAYTLVNLWHKIDGRFILIQQKHYKDGTITFYTDGRKEDGWEKI